MENIKTQPENVDKKLEHSPERRPTDGGAVHVEAFMRIFDPKSKETFVEGRA
jgi:hypothetical protein